MVFCEEAGRIVGEFNVNDIVDFLIHFWKFLTDGSYAERIGSVLADYVAPLFRAELLRSGSPLADPDFRQIVTVNLPIDHPPDEEDWKRLKGGGPVGSDFISSSYQQRLDGGPPWSYLPSPRPTLYPQIGSSSSSSHFGLIDLRRSPIDGDNLFHPSCSSGYSPRTSISSIGQLHENTINEQLILALFIVHHHQEVFLPLPSWFATRWFEDPKLTVQRFRKLRRAMNRKSRPRRTSEPIPTIRRIPTWDPQRTPSQGRASQVPPEDKQRSFFQELSLELDSSQHNDITSLDSGAGGGRRHLLPPPWTTTLDFWKRKKRVCQRFYSPIRTFWLGILLLPSRNKSK